MNIDYISQVIRPYVVEKKITYDDFERVFGFLTLREQYPIVNIIRDELKIDFVDEILTEPQISDEKISDETDSTIVKRANEIQASDRILIELVQRGDEQARQDLCTKHRGLVYKSAKYYCEKFPCDLELEDLVQEGYLGMLKAAEKFDFGEYTHFSKYATWGIVRAITRAIEETRLNVRRPVHLVEQILRATRLDRDFQMQGYGVSERLELIAEAMTTTVERVTELFRLRNVYMNLTSLDAPVDEDGDALLGDFIADENAASFILLKEQLDEVWSTLTTREKIMLTLRFGLADGKNRTLEEAVKNFDVTPERIRQIEAKALRKLRHPARSKKLHDFLD